MMARAHIYSIGLLLLLNVKEHSVTVYKTVIIPTQPLVTYSDPKYIVNISMNVRRVNRRGLYGTNLSFALKYPVGNNVTIDIVYYEYLHNEFKRSFVEMHFKLCDLIKKDPYLGWIVRSAGMTKCPLAATTYLMPNMTFSLEMPYKWPFEKAKAQMTVTLFPKKVIAVGEEVLTFVQKP